MWSSVPPWQWMGQLDGCRSGRRRVRAVPAGGSVRRDGSTRVGLRVAVVVGGTHLDGVVAGLRVPQPHPLTPGVDVVLLGEPRPLPLATVHGDLDPTDAAVLRPRDTGDWYAAGLDVLERLGYVDPRGR